MVASQVWHVITPAPHPSGNIMGRCKSRENKKEHEMAHIPISQGAKEPRNPWSHWNSLGSYDGGSPTTMVYSLTSTTNNDLILMLGPQPWYLNDGSIRPSMVRFPIDQCDRQNEFLNSLTGNSRTELRWMILLFLVLPACSLICQWKGLHLHLLNLLEMAIVHGYVWLSEGDA